ncbi:hypothetical protein ACFL12_05910 [Pseudomonadota bacterium]
MTLSATLSGGLFIASAASSDEAEKLLGPERLSPVVREIIDESADFSGAAQMKGIAFPQVEEPYDESSEQGSEPRFILKYISKDRRKDADASAMSEDIRKDADREGSQSHFTTRVETNLKGLPGKDLGSQLEKRTEASIASTIQAALTPKMPDDPGRIAPGIAQANPSAQMRHYRRTVENTLKKVDIDPHHPSIAKQLDAFDPDIDNKIAIARKNGDGKDLKPANIKTGSFAENVDNSANRHPGTKVNIPKPMIDGRDFTPPTPFSLSKPKQYLANKGTSIADHIFKETAKAVAQGRSIKLSDIQIPGAGDIGTGDINNISIDKGSIDNASIDKASIDKGSIDKGSIDNIDADKNIKAPTISDISQDFKDMNAGISIDEGPNSKSINADGISDGTKDNKSIIVKEPKQDINRNAGKSLSGPPKIDKKAYENRINAAVNKSVTALTTRVNQKLTDIEKIIKKKTSGAFDQIQKQIETQRDLAKNNAALKHAHASSIKVPVTKNDEHCSLHVIWCVKHYYTPNPDSLRKHNAAQARKDVADGEASAAKKQEQAWSAAYNSVGGKKADALNQISQAFSGARETVVSAALSSDPKPGVSTSPTPNGLATGVSKTQLTAAKSKVEKEATISAGDGGHLSLTGVVAETITASGAISAAVGDDSVVREYIGLIGRPGGGRESVNSVAAVISADNLVDAGVGYNTQALADIGSIEGDVSGTAAEVITAIGAINAAIGADSVAVLDVGTTKGRITGNEHLIVDATGIVNAAIGYETAALAKVGTISSPVGGRSSHGITLNVNAPLAVNAAVGDKSNSNLLVGNVDGEIHSPIMHRIDAGGAISASIGRSTESTVAIGNLSGNVSGTYKNNITTAGVIAAAIGNSSSADVLIGNVGSKAELNGSGKLIVNTVGAIAASIGSNSTSQISIGNIRDQVKGTTNLDITTGAVIAASLGGDTNAQVVIGDVNRKITGNLDSTIIVGDTTVFAMGGKADARAIIGVVDAPVTGNVNLDITAGEIFVGALGYRNNALTQIGYVHGRDDGGHIGGDVDLDITVGGVNNFSFGASTAGDGIHSRVSIGSILSNTTSNNKKTVRRGAVNAFSFGFDFYVPLLGTYFIGEQGCRDIADVGSALCPANANEITINRE